MNYEIEAKNNGAPGIYLREKNLPHKLIEKNL
jgi:hypothetical protein